MIKMNIIEKIIQNKKRSIARKKSEKSLKEIKKEAEDFISTKTEKFRFQEKLKEKNNTKIIAEFKVASPSQGDISNLKIKDIIPIYEKSPADMISIITEESYFKGDLKNLTLANNYTKKALLRKDFIIDEYMIYEAAKNNASCILLISGITPNIDEYADICKDLGMDSIIECHRQKDIESIVDYNPPIIGINNRNLENLQVNLETTKKLSKYVPNYLISESGVKSPDDAKKLKEYGADAILIGTSILEKNNKEKIKEHIEKIHNAIK